MSNEPETQTNDLPPAEAAPAPAPAGDAPSAPETTPPETSEAPKGPVTPGKRAQKGKTRPVLVYVVAMFAAAVLLLVLSFFMQQRNHAAIMQGLSTSQVNAQAVADLELENNRLDERIQALEEQLAAGQTDAEQLQADLEAAQKSRQAMDWLLAIQENYEEGDLTEALKLMVEFQDTGLVEHLPQTSALTEMAEATHPQGEYLSPAQRFAQMQEALS